MKTENEKFFYPKLYFCPLFLHQTGENNSLSKKRKGQFQASVFYHLVFSVFIYNFYCQKIEVTFKKW